MYLDIGGGSKVRNVNEPSLEVNLRWTKRGFFTKEEFKGYMEDEVFNYARKTGPSKSLSIDGNFVLVKS